jgi:two-component system response regulator AtoC
MCVGSGESLASLCNPRLIAFDGTLQIGRRPATEGGSDLVLADRTVSAGHARVRWSPADPDPFVLEDRDSRNGTFVDGKRIKGQTPLRNGAVVFVGSHVLVFRLVTPTELAAIQREAHDPLGPLATVSPALALASAKLRLLAPSNSEILLVGETGVGKEVFARAVHAASGRRGRFIAVNCAAIPAELVESELYGYERGAHSTAHTRKNGFVEMARDGTLFLDEIGDMNVSLQSKLLRFVQDRRFTPLGSGRTVEADVRIIAATSRTVTGQGAKIHEALLGRLGALPLTLPPLRDRVEDIGRLARYFLCEARANLPARADEPPFHPEAFQALALHGWPLNVRELSKVIAEAALLSRGATIGVEHLPESITESLRIGAHRGTQGARFVVESQPNRGAAELGAGGDTPPGTVAQTEKQQILEALALTAGNQSRAARQLKVSTRRAPSGGA